MVNGKRYFLVGIGGSGMMPLAMILAGRGAIVAGSDRSLDAGRVATKFDALRALGIALHPQDGSGVVSPDQIVVASAAVEDSVSDIVRATALDCARMTRAELNAALFNAAPVSIGVAGTSGKSTVTGMIAWILHGLGRDPTVMNGAVMANFADAGAAFASALIGGSDIYVSEVDESDRSIALYQPRIAVLNNVSLDHLALEELRALFGQFISHADHAVANVRDAEGAALADALPPARVTGFAVEADADLTAWRLQPRPFGIDFEVRERGGAPVAVSLQVPGRHNVANALAALGAARAAGIPLDQAAATLAGFTGLRRRIERIGEAAGVLVIDDFAHNPDKLAATIDTLHDFPGRLLMLFQPHGYGPLKLMRRELVHTLAGRIHEDDDDLLVLCDPVYHGGTVSREVGSEDIVADIMTTGARALYMPDRDKAAALLVREARPGDRIVVMGARDDTLSQLAARMLEGLAAKML